MERREFLKLSGAGVAGAGSPAAGSPEEPCRARGIDRSLSMVTGTHEDHRRRLRYLEECRRTIRKCMRQQMVGDYIPGHAAYNLGEYPSRKPWNPDEWDRGQLEQLSNAGIQWIHIHEEWNDPERLFGGDKFTPVNKEGFKRFIRWCHEFGLKVIPYTSSGYFERTDPDFRADWARESQDLIEVYYRYAHCSPASVSWRTYLLTRLRRILEEYEVDGLYNDVGYSSAYALKEPLTPDEINAFEESETVDGAFEDLLEMIYEEVKHFGGVVWLHVGQWYRGNRRPPAGRKLYDYFWVGEGLSNVDGLRETVKDHPPYLVPCIDMSRAKIANEDELYLHSIPYMQFPLLLTGRPFTGERVSVPGVNYTAKNTEFWMQHLHRVGESYRSHPEGPFTYGWWDSCPGRPDARPAYFRWLALYRPMVERGTIAYLEIADSDLFVGRLPGRVVASAFINRNMYLALGNFSTASVEVETRDSYNRCDAPAQHPDSHWRIPPRSMVLLRRSDVPSGH
jgi:hypothetical protein